MRKFGIIFFGLIFFSSGMHAQSLIALQHRGASSFHTNLDQAISAASNGDTLYIPGGYYLLNAQLSKELHFIGNGHHPDSTRVGGITYIDNVVYLKKGCSKSSFQGIYFINTISVVDTTLSNMIFKRCNLQHINSGTEIRPHLKNALFIENISREGINCAMTYCNFYNNIFQSVFYQTGWNCVFKNNIFLKEDSHPWVGAIEYCRFENNIFLYKPEHFPASFNTLYNNLFVFTPVFNGTTLIGSNNMVGQAAESVFVNLVGRSYLYTNNYRLKDGCPGKNAGTDGKDIGIYGGPFPWKDGSLPVNPHVQSKKVTSYTNADGSLNVNTKVAAQGN